MCTVSTLLPSPSALPVPSTPSCPLTKPPCPSSPQDPNSLSSPPQPPPCASSLTQRMAEAPPTTSDITVSNSNRGFCRPNSRSPQWGQSTVVPTPKRCPNRWRGEGPSPSRQDPGPVPCLSHPYSDRPAPSSTQTLREPWLQDEGCSAWHALFLVPFSLNARKSLLGG